jgi:hypothetical protein
MVADTITGGLQQLKPYPCNGVCSHYVDIRLALINAISSQHHMRDRKRPNNCA